MENSCLQCNKIFGSAQALEMHIQSKHLQEVKKPLFSASQKKKVKIGVISLIIIIGVISLIAFFVLNVRTLPPTTMQGHAEINPPSHIMKEPMKLVVYKHMLEHADGKGRGGIIINYNCEDFICEDGLIGKLEEFVVKYPEHVYVAPFQNMDARIVLTKLNQQKILEQYDETIIDDFVR